MALASFLERGAEAVEAGLPEPPVVREPRLELAERLRPQRIEAALPVRPHRDEAGVVQDAQMAGDTGLVDAGLPDDVVDLPLAIAQRLDDAAAGGIGKRLEGI